MLTSQVIGLGSDYSDAVTGLQEALQKLADKLDDQNLSPGPATGELTCQTGKAITYLFHKLSRFPGFGEIPSEARWLFQNAQTIICGYECSQDPAKYALTSCMSAMGGLSGGGLGDIDFETIKAYAPLIMGWAQKLYDSPSDGTSPAPSDRYYGKKDDLSIRDRLPGTYYDPEYSGMQFLTPLETSLKQYPYAITAQNKAGEWRVAVPKLKTLSGPIDPKNDHKEIAVVDAKPRGAGIATITLAEYKKLAGRWYEKPVILAVLGVGAVGLGATGYYFATRSK